MDNERGYLELSLFYIERRFNIYSIIWICLKLFEDISKYWILCHNGVPYITNSIKEWVSFFLGSWDMNRSAEQTNRVNREAVLVRFVCSALRFISHEPRKKDTHSLYLQCLQQRPLLKFSEQSKKFKFPAEIGHLTLFPDKTIIAYSFRQNSAWINGEKVVCCECFHTLKQY